MRWLSALPLAAKPRLVTTDGEFHTLRRQLARLGRKPASRSCGCRRTRSRRSPSGWRRRSTSAPPRCSLRRSSSRRRGSCPRLGELAAECRRRETPLLVDAYHALGVAAVLAARAGTRVGAGHRRRLQVPAARRRQRLPPPAAGTRPASGGDRLVRGVLDEDRRARGGTEVDYAPGAAALAGATYDPTSHYRAARVFDFFVEQGLTPEFLRQVSQHQVGLLARAFDALASARSASSARALDAAGRDRRFSGSRHSCGATPCRKAAGKGGALRCSRSIAAAGAGTLSERCPARARRRNPWRGRARAAIGLRSFFPWCACVSSLRCRYQRALAPPPPNEPPPPPKPPPPKPPPPKPPPPNPPPPNPPPLPPVQWLPRPPRLLAELRRISSTMMKMKKARPPPFDLWRGVPPASAVYSPWMAARIASAAAVKPPS